MPGQREWASESKVVRQLMGRFRTGGFQSGFHEKRTRYHRRPAQSRYSAVSPVQPDLVLNLRQLR